MNKVMFNLSLLIVALLLPTFILGQVRNISTIPVQIIPVNPTAEGGQCPSDEQLQNTLNLIKMDVLERLQSMTPPPPECGDPSIWRRVVHIDMSDETQNCPTGLTFNTYDTIRTCGRLEDAACSPVTFSMTGGEYNQVCGRIRGYQWGETNAFYSASALSRNTIDQQYLDGVSLTHGAEGNREHIWSFAAGRTQNGMTESFDGSSLCPCDLSEIDASKHPAPSFINGGYFCESGAYDYTEDMLPGIFSDDPLWDGENCREESRCCQFNTPPWFTKELSAPTTDDIELRLCLGGGSKEVDIPLDLIELYVQ